MIGRRWHAPVLVAAVLAVGSLLAPAQAPAAAGSDGPCPGTTGVTVVVDYQALGGGVVVVVRCAGGSPATGFEALKKAGFAIEEVSNMPGFLCRIDRLPGPDREDCIGTPPGSAYWSYWHASRGGTWKVSAEGGGTRTPPPGSVEGWSFSDDGSPGAASPRIDPPAATATPKPVTPKPTATPKPATPKPATPRPKPATTPRPTPATPSPESTAQPIDTPASIETPTPIPSAATAAATPATAVGPAEVSPTPTVDTTAVAAVGTTSGGSPPLGTLLGIGLVLLIAVGALVTRSRRATGRGGDA